MKKALNSRRGAAMILVLCIMAMITALCLSLLYGLAQITANANRRVDLIRTRQTAVSVSDTLRDSLIDENGDVITAEPGSGELADVVQHFLNSADFVALRPYKLSLQESSLPPGCTDITVTLVRGTMESPGVFDQSDPKWIDLTNMGKYQGILDIQVTVTTGTGATDVTYHYECQPDLSRIYYYENTDLHKMELLERRDGGFYLNGEQLKVMVETNGEWALTSVTEKMVNMKSGLIEGSDNIYLYNGFLTSVPYLLDWQGEV